MNVYSVFSSYDGEANAFSGIGEPSIFVRTFGCSLNCSYCDTRYAKDQTAEALGELTPEQIWKLVRLCGPHQKITLTGGEPLDQPWTDLFELLRIFELECRTTVETNGSHPLFHIKRRPSLTRFVLDYKLPGSGQEHHMVSQFFKSGYGLSPVDRVKFVVVNKDSLRRAGQIIEMNGADVALHQYILSPVTGYSGFFSDLTEVAAEASFLRLVPISFQAHKLGIWRESK
jgi:7-carboxy-7-deazaguanine synthase